MKSLTEVTELVGYGTECLQITGTGCRVLVQVHTRPSCKGTFSVQKSQNCRVRVREVYRTYRNISGTVWRLHRKPYQQPGIVTTVPVPPVTVREAYRPDRPVGYRYESLTELTELSGTGMKVLQKSQNCPVPVRTRKNTPGIQKPILYPTEHTLGK